MGHGVFVGARCIAPHMHLSKFPFARRIFALSSGVENPRLPFFGTESPAPSHLCPLFLRGFQPRHTRDRCFQPLAQAIWPCDEGGEDAHFGPQ